MSARSASPEEFVRTWQAAESALEVAKKLGLDVHIVHNRATRYRQMGVRLKAFRDVRPPLVDVVALNRIIAGTRDHICRSCGK